MLRSAALIGARALKVLMRWRVSRRITNVADNAPLSLPFCISSAAKGHPPRAQHLQCHVKMLGDGKSLPCEVKPSADRNKRVA